MQYIFNENSFFLRITGLRGERTGLKDCYKFLLCKITAILSKINSSAGSHFTLRKFFAVSQAEFSCSKSSSFPESTRQAKHCMER